MICVIEAVGRAIGGAVGWEWSCCWRWVLGAAIGGTQVAQLELSGLVGSEPNVVHHTWWGHCLRWDKLSVRLSVVWSQPKTAVPCSQKKAECGRLSEQLVATINHAREATYMPSSCSFALT
jgi:hypothetical protein